MTIKVGSQDVQAIYVGSTPVQEVYVGSTKIWSATPVTWYKWSERSSGITMYYYTTQTYSQIAVGDIVYDSNKEAAYTVSAIRPSTRRIQVNSTYWLSWVGQE